MRAILLALGVATPLLALIACAATDDPARPEENVEPSPSLPDASSPEVAVGVEDSSVGPPAPQCSSAGWCETVLPEDDLVLRDVWPLAERAFAIADSYNSGIRVLEWTSAAGTWKAIDDNRQNEALAASGVAVWAPNDDEVYYAVSPGAVYHGKRKAPPETAWSWSGQELPNTIASSSPQQIPHFQRRWHGIWGRNANEVYAWSGDTVFRRTDAGGTERWVEEYVANDLDTPQETLFITGVSGDGSSALWFLGARWAAAQCDVIVRKTPSGYQRVADGVTTGGGRRCSPRPGVPLLIDGFTYVPEQWQSVGGERFVYMRSSNSIFSVAPEGSGYSVRSAKTSFESVSWNSLWAESPDRLWLGGSLLYRSGVVVESTNPFADGGTHEVSSTARNGAPSSPPNRIRGTSATNLWAVGDRYALHKTR